MKSDEELKNLHGQTYVDSFVKRQSESRLSRLVDKIEVVKSDRVVDFACGAGLMMPYLSPKVDSYIGVDFSEAFIAVARNKSTELGFSNTLFYCADIIEFCQKNKQAFDVALAMDFSEHVYDENWLNLLKAIRASLRQNGRLYLHTPNADFFIELFKQKNFLLKQFPEHVAVRNIQENRSLLESAGFVVTKCHAIPHYNILKFLHVFSRLPIIGKYFEARIFIEAKLV